LRAATGLSSALVWFALAAGGAQAQGTPPPREQLRGVEQSLQQTRARSEAVTAQEQALADELGQLQQSAVGLAATVREQERALRGLRAEEAALAAREAAARQALSARQEDIARLTTALARLAREPVEPLLVDPSPTLDRARAAIALDHATRDLEASAARLRAELDQLAALASALAAKRSAVESAAATLAAERARLDRVLAERRGIYRQREGERKALEARADTLAREAETLRELIERVEAEQQRLAQFRPPPKPHPQSPPLPNQGRPALEPPQAGRPAPPASGPAAPAPGGLLAALPVEGDLITRFGGPDKAGLTARGVVWRAVVGATVLAPRDGIVRFAGRFRNQGQILILEHGGEYHSLLGGLADVSAAVGESVLAGEPVGTVADTGGGGGEVYLELRRNGRPLDPLGLPTAARN
jgi:septal ring factor EnvC (AmiA/AmiB activator)